MRLEIKAKFVLLCFVLGFPVSYQLWAQDNEALFNKYHNDPAILTQVNEKLVIAYNHNQWEAKSYNSREKLLISNLSPGTYNKEYIFHSYFNKLEDYDVQAKVYANNGYKKLKTYTSKTLSSELEDIFYDDIKETEFTFSGLTPHSFIQTSYTISYPDIHMLPTFYFERSLPIANATFQVTAPKNVYLKFVIKGDKDSRIIQKTEESKHSITYTFSAADIPALTEYDDVPSDLYNRIHIIPYIASVDTGNNQVKDILSKPASLYNYYYNFIKDINLHEDKDLSAKVNELTQNDHSQTEKAAHIFNWVQQNIYYIAFEDSLGGFIPRQAADIFKRKFGDCKDMASILVAMCRKAGIAAYFTWIGTSKLPYNYDETPLPLVDNHMICTIKIDGNWIFLDGTNQVLPFGQSPSGIQNKQAMVALDPNNFIILKVPVTDMNKNTTTDSTFISINNTRITGHTSINYKGYPSWNIQALMLYNHNRDRDELLSDIFSRGSNKYAGKNFNFSHSDTGMKDCSITDDFTLDDYVRKIGKEIYVNLNLKRFYENSHVDTAGRQVPVYYKFKDIYHEVMILDIPQGYHVSYTPPNDSAKIDNVLEYSLHYKIEGRKIILFKEYRFYSITLPVAQFVAFNKLIDQLKTQYKETVVLTADN
jgi:transglutaminase-like putative cysteine protease